MALREINTVHAGGPGILRGVLGGHVSGATTQGCVDGLRPLARLAPT